MSEFNSNLREVRDADVSKNDWTQQQVEDCLTAAYHDKQDAVVAAFRTVYPGKQVRESYGRYPPCAEPPNVWPPGRIGQRRRATGAGSWPMPQMCPSVRITMTPSEMAGVAMITSPMECFASSMYSRPACATTTSPSSFAM